MAAQKEKEQAKHEQFMSQMVDLDYVIRSSPVQQRFDEQMKEGRITGHKCPECGLVYCPPKGYCPLCSVITGREHEVEVSDRGVVTSFTVITPIQYRGQEETEEYVLASLLLDGADSTVGQQRIEEIPHDEVRMGLRVKAAWRPPAEREGDASGGGRFGIGDAIAHWVPTGEPDADPSDFQEHIL